jgi:sugar/nucleoside kinase (ribokinase family)
VRALANHFEVACVKLGEEGAIATRSRELVRAAAGPVTRRSLFGAGDAFAAGFLVAIARQEPLQDALEAACEAGARAAAAADGLPSF